MPKYLREHKIIPLLFVTIMGTVIAAEITNNGLLHTIAMWLLNVIRGIYNIAVMPIALPAIIQTLLLVWVVFHVVRFVATKFSETPETWVVQYMEYKLTYEVLPGKAPQIKKKACPHCGSSVFSAIEKPERYARNERIVTLLQCHNKHVIVNLTAFMEERGLSSFKQYEYFIESAFRDDFETGQLDKYNPTLLNPEVQHR